MMIDEIAKNPKVGQKIQKEVKIFAEIVVETVRESLIILDSDLKVISANSPFYKTFRVNPKETIGKYIYDLGNGQWDIPQLRTLLEDILPKKNTFENYEMNHNFETIGQKTMLLNARRLDDLHLILLAIEDITKSKQAEEKRKLAEDTMEKSEIRYRGLITASRDAIMTIEPPTWEFTSGNPATLALFNAKSEKEFLSYAPWKLSPEYQPDGKKSVDKAKEMIEKAMKEGSNFFEWTHKRITGENFFADVLLSRIEEQGRIFLHAVVRDITQRKKMEEELREYEKEKFKIVFDNATDGMLVADVKTKKLYISNNAMCRMLGYTLKEIQTLTIADIHPKDKLAVVVDQFEKLIKRDITLAKDVPMKRKDGSTFYADINTSIINMDGIEGLLGIFRDTTERKRIESELLRLNRSLRMLSNSNKTLIHAVDETTLLNKICQVIVESGDYRLAWIGFAKNDEAKTIQPMAHAGFESGYIEMTKLSWGDNERGKGPGGIAIRTGLPSIARNILTDPACIPWREEAIKRRFQSVIALPLTNDQRTFGVLGVYAEKTDAFPPEEVNILMELANDLSFGINTLRLRIERKETEELLQRSEEKYRTLIDHMHDGIFIIQDEKLQFINKAFATIAGYTTEELIGKKFQDFLVPEYKKLVSDRYTQRQQGLQVPDDYEIQILRKDGTPIDVTLSVGIITYDGKVASMGILKDISAWKKAEKALRTLSSRQKAILEAIPDIIMEVNNDKIYTWANQSGLDFFGQDVIGKSADFYFEGKQDVYEAVQPIFKGSEDTIYVESWQRRKDGQKRLLAWWCKVLKNEKGTVTGALSSARDITDHKEMEEKIIEDKSKDEAILDSIGDAVFACDKKGRIVLFNNMAEKLTGIAAKDAFGRHYSQTMKFIKETDETPSEDFIREAIKKNKITQMANHTMLVKNDGTKIPVADSAAPIKNARGDIIGCVVVFHDVTREREIDKAKTEFVSLASHQLRTPLSVINWYAELLLSNENGILNPKQHQYAEEAYHASKRMVNLVNALLNVSRLELGTFTVEPESVHVTEIMKLCIRELQPQIMTKKLTIEESYDPDIAFIQADPKLLSIIFQNLLSNAVKYTPVEGKIYIYIKKQHNDMLITVRDTGIGIPEYQKEKIFTKLFRADNVHIIDAEGSGLGLYIVNEIIKAAGGKVWFESEENKGSTFFITIPESGMVKKGGMRQLI